MGYNYEQKTKEKSEKILVTASIILAVLLLFALVFCLYDSPAKYMPTNTEKVAVDANGEPMLYYTDLFGCTFYMEDGKRLYAAVLKPTGEKSAGKWKSRCRIQILCGNKPRIEMVYL